MSFTAKSLCFVLSIGSSLLAAAASPSMELVTVQGGCFPMGNTFTDGYHLEKPVHEVCVSSFSISIHDTTLAEFKAFVAESGYVTDAERGGQGCHIYDGTAWHLDPKANWRTPGFSQTGNHPVVCVSWNDAIAYSSWLSRKEKREYRLPTEAEWEYAARSGGRQERYAGGDSIDAVAWYAANAGNGTRPVGSKQPNGLGLYDMSGNVWQWTADWYGENYYRESPRDNPRGPANGTKRIFRGGSWFYDARANRASYRDFYFPTFASSYLGFRLVAPAK